MDKVPARNDLCPCGSGKKYKKCCGFNMDLKKQIKAKIKAQGPFAAAFGGASATGLARDFFKQVKVTPIKSTETMTALDRMKENNKKDANQENSNKPIEQKDEV